MCNILDVNTLSVIPHQVQVKLNQYFLKKKKSKLEYDT